MSQPNFTGLAGGLSLLGLLVAAPAVLGQGLGNSPYSRLGLGDASLNAGGVRQMGMGGIGVAAPNSINVNEINPALLYYTARTTFEAGYTGQFKTLRNTVSRQRTGSANLGYLALAVPINRRWAGAIGLKPYSTVDYESTTLDNSVVGDLTAQVEKQYKGSGGLAEAYMSHGVRLATGLTAGVSVGYVFGSIDQEAGTRIGTATIPVELSSKDIYQQHIYYSDFTFRAGLHYRGKFTDKLNYNIGGTHSFRSNLNGDRSLSLIRQDFQGIQSSTTAIETDAPGKAQVPALSQVGISLDNNRSWSASLEGTRQEWSQFRAFDEQGGSSGIPLSDTYRVALGGELTPDAASVDSYFKRVTYRAGLSLAQMPYRPGGKALYDRSVSWGFAFPLPTATPLDATTISLAFMYGQRGNTDVRQLADGSLERNVKEDYVRMQLGVTLNNRWFIKRRIE
ncbi:outer membrane protein transport protein [Hymenobacter sublimis]|uniref:Outer membrane protein transport protein n=2 Tax=Hymenobacter TaxID=89966 RepID=A0ABY4J8G9_9BACT|nr:outer membrane protein transport protein [Hymenobacter sublimis]UPL49104.1 outer membrane protein transport protein [Hymenobacter sublimis]